LWYDGFFAELENCGDGGKASEMAAYMKNRFPFLGIPKPELDKLMRPYFRAAHKSEKGINWDFIRVCWKKEYREAQYVGIAYLFSMCKKVSIDDLERLKVLIVSKSWWDTSDSLDNIVGNILMRYPDVTGAEMIAWSKSDNLWLRRVSINCQHKFKENTNLALLENIICNNFGTGEFFIDKAIGWSLRDYSKVNPGWVKCFLFRHEGKMSRLSIREAGKYL